MSQRNRTSTWARTFQRQIVAMTRLAAAAGKHARAKAPQRVVARPGPAPEAGGWSPGVAFGASDAEGFAASTRMNRVALRERFLVLYPEQDRLANAQGCWNWFDTDSGRAYDELALIMKAIDQVCLLHPVNGTQVVVAGLSAGASMAALVEVQGLAHAWSGGADRQPFGDAQGPDASRMAWAFAARQLNALDDACVAPEPRRATAR